MYLKTSFIWNCYGVEMLFGSGKNGDNEVDFVTRSETGETPYYQVAYTAKETVVMQRKLCSLQQIKDHYPKYLLTTDEYESEIEGIKIRNVANWLLH
jgi:predicted AAA+ superfamily ATPase